MACRDLSSSAPRHRPRVRTGSAHPARRCLLAIAVVAIAGCQGKDGGSSSAIDGFGAAQQPGQATSTKPLRIALDGAHTADRISVSGFDAKQPATGNRFVVLDVDVRNTDTQPRVFSEGKLVAVDEQRERTFATPVNIFADGYLQLQVLQPSASARGKIVYEVPGDMKGVLYWVPGEGGERILLHLQPELASKDRINRDRIDNGSINNGSTKRAATTSSVAQAADPEPVAGNNAMPAAPVGAEPGDEASVAPAATQAVATASPGGGQARAMACQALVSRNDPAEKSRYVAFFKRQCAGYAFPPAWAAPAQVATATLPPPIPDPATRWPPRAGPAFDCEQAFTRAEHLICEDSVLSLMDWELTRTYASAARTTDDQAALQREQDDWRRHVRDACTTVRCIEDAYAERTADLTAMTRPP
ncbi:DUF4352 domain-containing protein [Cognatiluteimonas profundi]|uniref:DUF4352 domain-containing protein n=1 Tax=Cognatiluteimonas profundi TaxID=2594501 RepID=UPI00131DA9F6|nr:DUF4352 domain-containing protein [Lysobacter profundi]